MDYSFNSLYQMMEAMNRDGGMAPQAMMETFMPYMPEAQRQQTAGFMRALELHKNLCHIQRTCAGPERMSKMCGALRPCVTPKMQLMIDLMLKISEAGALAEEVFASDYDSRSFVI